MRFGIVANRFVPETILIATLKNGTVKANFIAGLRCGLAVADPHFDLPQQGYDFSGLYLWIAITGFLLGGFSHSTWYK